MPNMLLNTFSVFKDKEQLKCGAVVVAQFLCFQRQSLQFESRHHHFMFCIDIVLKRQK